MLDQLTRARVRMHLGYPNVDMAPSLQLGIPSQSQPLFMLESGLNHLLPAAEDLVVREVAELDCILAQISAARDRLRVSKVDEVTMRQDELDALLGHYSFWREKLAMELGAIVNPFAVDLGGPVRLRVLEHC